MSPKQISIPVTDYAIQADWYEGADGHAVLLTFVGFSSNNPQDQIPAYYQAVNDWLSKTSLLPTEKKSRWFSE